jgi:hypothetical protein|tara:strand:- start:241 stop:492 length:252 start_codon:yes stop_codon:yes gene_type:complete
MPRIPPINLMGDKDYDFAKNIYLTMKAFMPTDTISSLRSHYRDNLRALETMKRMNPDLYDQLIEDFKIRKEEIKEQNFGKKES